MEKVILLGAGGHCKVVMDLLKGRYDITGITDINAAKHGTLFYGVCVMGDDEILPSLYHKGLNTALVTLGSTGDNSVRKKLYDYAANIGFHMINAVSSNSIISSTVKLGNGNVIMDGVIIHSDAVVKDNVILNTGAIIEHDCMVESHAHICPGAKLAGGVKIGEGSYIGLGASIIQGISIGRNCIIGAGAVVIKDIPDNSVAVGVPAKIIKQR